VVLRIILKFIEGKAEKMSKTYQTQGKNRLESFLSSHPDAHFTVDEICIAINGDMSAKSSVYRNLSELCRDGKVRKFKGEGENACVYQYLGEDRACRDHFHLKCIECGHLEHLECFMGKDLCQHIGEHHGFTVDSGRSILYGVCAKCCSKTDQKQQREVKN